MSPAAKVGSGLRPSLKAQGVGVRQVTYEVDRDVSIAMRDGTTLRADVWRPSVPGRYPVALQRTPYNKGLSFIGAAHSGIEPLRTLEHGFVVVIQDARGCHRSDGTFEAFVNEEQDGHDTVAWILEQDFSDGNVFMYGGSYVGATQMLSAVSTPPGLRGIVPQLTASDYYDGWAYRGGALELGFLLYWAISAFMPAELVRLTEPSEAARLGKEFVGLFADPVAAYDMLPLTGHDAVNRLVPSYRKWLEHPRRDEYWRGVAVRDRYGSIAVPALHIAGWFDIFAEGTIENFVRLRTEAATDEARDGQYLIVGPWAHGNTGDAGGGTYFGGLSALATFDLTQLQLDFYDAIRNGKTLDWPHVRAFDLGDLEWRTYEGWPPTGARAKRLYLASGGAANSASGDGVLVDEPRGSPPDVYVYDPTDPVSTVGGATFLPGILIGLNSGPRDQAEVERRRDVLVYTSESLTAPLQLAGPVHVRLTASTSAKDTDWTANLVRVRADGSTALLCGGILRARYAGGTDRARFLPANTPHEFVVSLGHTCIRLTAGERLRLDVSSSNYPRFDRNPNSDVEPAQATAADLRRARQTVHHDPIRPSWIDLTVAP